MHSEVFKWKCIDVWIYFIFKLFLACLDLHCFLKLILFIYYFWLCWVFLAVRLFSSSIASPVAEPRLQGTQASVVVAPSL